MIEDHDHIDAIFLVARYGREAPQVADGQRLQAADRGDRNEVRRWRGIRRFIRRSIGPMEAVPVKNR
ncbi:hypothetical protein [Sphingomonas sp. Leaf4]|uniref:hypothetical protein n=1 Tax=Sphingomonas sp. Leaf4 TaxID=2876553 RepID=UPI001E2F9D1E|nr:hypothetical protein [Sphingomonas sp. Leaf4]